MWYTLLSEVISPDWYYNEDATISRISVDYLLIKVELIEYINSLINRTVEIRVSKTPEHKIQPIQTTDILKLLTIKTEFLNRISTLLDTAIFRTLSDENEVLTRDTILKLIKRKSKILRRKV